MTIYLVVLMSFLSQAGFGGSRVTVALHALALTSNQFAIGLIIALYSICPMLLAISIGRFADRTSPRKMVLLGSILLPTALIMPCLFPSLVVLYLAAVVLGCAHQVVSLPQEAMVGGIGGADKRARNYTLITMAWSAANFIGPIVAGFSIDHIGQREVQPIRFGQRCFQMCTCSVSVAVTEGHAGVTDFRIDALGDLSFERRER